MMTCCSTSDGQCRLEVTMLKARCRSQQSQAPATNLNDVRPLQPVVVATSHNVDLLSTGNSSFCCLDINKTQASNSSSEILNISRCSPSYPLLFENHKLLFQVCCALSMERTNSSRVSASLVRHSLLHFHLSHMAVHHLHYHCLHLLLLAQYFILNSRLVSSANPFLHRPFPFLPD